MKITATREKLCKTTHPIIFLITDLFKICQNCIGMNYRLYAINGHMTDTTTTVARHEITWEVIPLSHTHTLKL